MRKKNNKKKVSQLYLPSDCHKLKTFFFLLKRPFSRLSAVGEAADNQPTEFSSGRVGAGGLSLEARMLEKVKPVGCSQLTAGVQIGSLQADSEADE